MYVEEIASLAWHDVGAMPQPARYPHQTLFYVHRDPAKVRRPVPEDSFPVEFRFVLEEVRPEGLMKRIAKMARIVHLVFTPL